MRPRAILLSGLTLLLCLLCLPQCGGGGQPIAGGSPAYALALGQSATLIRDARITPDGGTVRVAQPGHALDGLTLTIGTFAYQAGTSVTLRAAAITGHSFGALLRPVTPLITLENDGQPIESGVMHLRIPVTTGDGEAPMALAYDARRGAVEVLSPLAVTDTSLTVGVTRLAPPVNLAAPGGTAGGLALFVAAVRESALPTVADSGLRPAAHGWQFPNVGSFITPGGQCLGWSCTALYHYLTRRGTSPILYGRYDNSAGGFPTPQCWQDDADAYRLAVAAQHAEDGVWWTYLQALPASTPRLDRLQALACRLAIHLTGEPQLVSLFNPGGRAHVTVAYRVAGDEIALADPEYPADDTRRLTVGDNGFGHYEAYYMLHYLSRSTAIRWEEIAELWGRFDGGQLGSDLFPRTRLEWRDGPGAWREVTGPLVTAADGIELRARVENVATPGWIAYTRAPQALDAAPVIERDQRVYPLAAGEQIIGVNILGIPDGQSDWHWVDFQWLTIRRP
ncbi:MAG TPA: hypothetical protein PLZ36_04170 [Armatimonadota bacterium]|nr:hypothetical protein [Armatimonadota bacterium]HOS43152.1 hypothetical protein [Armatimonadota bacterium]